MNGDASEEARTARIQRYKEDRRRQLTARTAAALSSNVTERRPSKKLPERAASDSCVPSPEAAPSSYIRTTRASRLRAAASADATPARASSTLTLAEAGKKRREKARRNSRQLSRDAGLKVLEKCQKKCKENDTEPKPVDAAPAKEAKKVERFSELVATITSPGEAERLFEDLVPEDAPENLDFTRLTETPRAPPPPACRRHVTPPHDCSTPKRLHRQDNAGGPMSPSSSFSPASGAVKPQYRRPLNTPPKTEFPLPNSTISPKCSSTIAKKDSPLNSSRESKSSSSSPQNTWSKTYQRSSRSSLIPLAKRLTESSETKTSPTKHDLKETTSKIPEHRHGKDSSVVKCQAKARNGTVEKSKRNRSSNTSNEKYHKRLTSVDKSKDTDNIEKTLNIMQPDFDVNSTEEINLVEMSTIHEKMFNPSVRSHINTARLSQRMDSLEALTKRTLDRVNKLSKDDRSTNGINLDATEAEFDALFASSTNAPNDGALSNLRQRYKPATRGVTERLRDIDTAAQRLIDFEKKNPMFCDLKNDTSQNRRSAESSSLNHAPVSILKRKSMQEENGTSSASHSISSPPVTFSPNVIDAAKADKKQGILKKRRSLDESQVARRRSCSPEVSFVDDGPPDISRPILKNRRSSLEDVLRNHSPDSHIQGILKRKMSKEEELEDNSIGSPEPQGILKRKSASSSSSSATSSHVSIAQAVILAAAGGAEIVEEDKDGVRPILKKKSFSEERPCLEVQSSDCPKPILKKKSFAESDDYEFDRPKKPILKTSKRLSSEEGNASSFDLSEDDRGSRRPSLLKSRTSDYSGSECETTVKPILKQKRSNLSRERSQSPRPRLSFCADNEIENFIADPHVAPSTAARAELENPYPSSVLRRRNQRPRNINRSRSLACEVNAELLSILNDRRLKVDETCDLDEPVRSLPSTSCVDEPPEDRTPKTFLSIAARIKMMEKQFSQHKKPSVEQPSRVKRDKNRFRTQPITLDEMHYASSCLEPGQAEFGAFGFPRDYAGSVGRFEESSAGTSTFYPEEGCDVGTYSHCLDSLPGRDTSAAICPFDQYQERSELSSGYGASGGEELSGDRRTLEELQSDLDRVLVALDADVRALEENERAQAEADTWSLNVSYDSGVYNRASSRDSGPHSGEELGLIESQEIKENQNCNREWEEPGDMEPGDDEDTHCVFKRGLVKSNSVVARASMWQQLQQQAKGVPRPPLLRHQQRSKTKDLGTLDVAFTAPSVPWRDPKHRLSEAGQTLAQSNSGGNLSRSLDRDDEAKLDEDDPAKMSLVDKMKMFNTRLNYKPPVAEQRAVRKEDRTPRAKRLKTMPVLASQVPPPPEEDERLCKSFTMEEVPRDADFHRKMALFRSASLRNTSLKYVMEQNEKNKILDAKSDEACGGEPAQRAITPEIRGILKAGSTRATPIGKGESSEGLEDEGINSSSDDESAVSSSSSEKCTTSSSDDLPPPKPKRSPPRYVKNKLKSSRTDSDLARVLKDPYPVKKDSYPVKKDSHPTKIQLPCLNEMKDRLNRVQTEKKEDLSNQLAKLSRQPTKEKENVESEEFNNRVLMKRPLKEPIQIGKLRRSNDMPLTQSLDDMTPPKIQDGGEAVKKRLSGPCDDRPRKSLDEIAAAVRKYIPQPVSKSASMAYFVGCRRECPESGSDGESSGGREVRQINARRTRHRGGAVVGGGVQRSATQAEMPHQGGVSIAERLAALQAAGANDWRARVIRPSPENEDDTKAIERAKNRINETLNTAVDEKKKAHLDEDDLGSNILADRRNKLETAAQGWRKRVPQTDAVQFSVAGRLERDKVSPATPPATPPVPSSPRVPQLKKFGSRKPTSPPNGAGPLRSASCVAVGTLVSSVEDEPPPPLSNRREQFARSHSVTENINQAAEETAAKAAKAGASVPVPRADDETFTAFFKSASSAVVDTELLNNNNNNNIEDADLDAVDNNRQLLVSNATRRARLVNRRAASRNPLRALAERTDLKTEYTQPPPTGIADREQRRINLEKVTGGCGLAAEALAALAAKEDFASVALRTAGSVQQNQNQHTLMLLHIKGRRRVQTRLVEPVYSNVNRGDCFVLVTPDHVFHYMGYYSNVIERTRGADVALHIHNTKDLGCKSSAGVTTINEHAKNFSNKHWNHFWNLLGAPLDEGEFNPVEAGHADEDEIFESTIIQTNMCYELMDDELVPIKEYWGQVPKISMLSPSKVMVFDFGTEMYIWNGKLVPLDKRRLAAQLAQEMFDEGYNYEDCHVNPLTVAGYQGAREGMSETEKKSKKRPEWAVITKVTQHMENILFKEKFLDWPDFTRVIKVKNPENKSSFAEIKPCDAEKMLTNAIEDPDLVLEGAHVGRGTHYYDKETMRHFDIKTKSVSKWIVQDADYQKIENECEIPEFYSGDSYIIRWEYQITVTGRELNGKPSKHNTTGRDRCAYFCWQGKDASSNDKGTAALLTVELDKEKGPQLRVSQGSEPPAFLNLFQGNLIIHQGKRGVDKSRYRLYVVRGNTANEAYLLQVPCSMRQLRSRASLLLADTEKGFLYIWHGARSMKHTKQVSVEVANRLIARKSPLLNDPTVLEVKEGEEPASVLSALGGANRQLYHSCLEADGASAVCGASVTPRLFHFTDLSGRFEAHETLSPLRCTDLATPFPFDQKELYAASQPALFMLDDGVAVWLWQGWWPDNDGELELERNSGVGAFAARWQALRSAALSTCVAYWHATQRDKTPDVRVVVAGLEPLAFTNLFDSWRDRDDVADVNMQYGYKANEILSGPCELSRLNSDTDVILPLAALQQRPLPEDVHPQHLERHLSTPDFLEAFGMNKAEFADLPAWKQANLKKDLGLF